MGVCRRAQGKQRFGLTLKQSWSFSRHMISSPPALVSRLAEDIHVISHPSKRCARVYVNVNDIRNGRVANWKPCKMSNVCVHVFISLTAPASLLRPSASAALGAQLEPLLIMNQRLDERGEGRYCRSSWWRRPEWVVMTASRWRKDAAAAMEICVQ